MKLIKYTGIFIVFIAAAYYGLVFMAPKELTFQVNEDFNAPIDSVFLFMTDPSYLSQWVEGIDSVNEEINTNSGVGNQFQLYYQGKNSMVMNKTVLLFQTNKAFSTHGLIENLFEWDEKIAFESLGHNQTRVSNIITLKSISHKTRLLMYAEDTHKKNVANNYLKLKELIE